MEKINITIEQFNKAIENAFKEGENWALCYSTWFKPTENETKSKIETAKKTALNNLNR